MPNRVRGGGGETSTSKLVVLVALILWSLPRIIGTTGDSMQPGVQDPEAQVGLDTWIMQIQTYLKDNILPSKLASTNRIVHVAKRYMLVEGDLYQHGANDILMQFITRE
jgi:hypothetical protein